MNRHRPRIWTLMCSALTLSLLLASSFHNAVAAPPAEEAVKTLVATIPVGVGSDKITVETRVEGRTPDGPQSLSVAPDGRIYVLDSAQGQILVLKQGVREKTIPVPFTTYPLDILVAKNRLFILDSRPVVYEASMSGELLKTHPLPEGMGSKSVYRLAEARGAVVLWAENYTVIPLDHMPKAIDLKANAKNDQGRGVELLDGRLFRGKYNGVHGGEIVSSDGAVKIPVTTEQTFGSMMITAVDKQANLYAVVEELADPAPVVATEITIRRYDRKGAQTGVAKFSGQDFAAYPSRAVDVTPSGDVYVMVPTTTKVDIYRVELGRHYTSDLPAVRDRMVQAYSPKMSAMAMDYAPEGRPSTRSRSYQMTDYTWTWDASKYNYFSNGTGRPADAPRPTQLPATGTSAQTGIPYTWGGWDTPFSASDGQPWSSFGTSLSYYATKGPLVGNSGTSTGGTWYSGSSGVDCSGFVSAAVWVYSFGKPKPGTGALSTDAITVYDTVANSGSYSAYSAMQPMDFFVNSGHVFEYDRRKLDGTGIETIESTTAKANVSGDVMQGAKKYWRTWTEVSGFTHKTWWTRTTGDDFGDPYLTTGSYSGIKGEMQYFKFSYSSSVSSTVSVTVTPSTGDPDLYVYSSSYGLIGQSYSAGADTVSWTATPGSTYYIGVHMWTDASYTISKSW